MKKGISISVFVIVGLLAVLGGVTWYIRTRPSTTIEQPGIVKDARVVDKGDVSFVVPKGWDVHEVQENVFQLQARTLAVAVTAPVTIDVSGSKSYRESLEEARSRLQDLVTDSLLVSGLMGQELSGIVYGGSSSPDRYAYYSYLDNGGKLVSVAYEAYERPGTYLNEYQIIRSSLKIANRVTYTNTDELVQRDNAGREIVPFYIRDGIDATHTFTNGIHTVSGTISLPTPCHVLDTKTIVGQSMPEFVMIQFTVTEPADVLCAQVVTDKSFTVTFQASADATIRASFNTLPVTLRFME